MYLHTASAMTVEALHPKLLSLNAVCTTRRHTSRHSQSCLSLLSDGMSPESQVQNSTHVQDPNWTSSLPRVRPCMYWVNSHQSCHGVTELDVSCQKEHACSSSEGSLVLALSSNIYFAKVLATNLWHLDVTCLLQTCQHAVCCLADV